MEPISRRIRIRINNEARPFASVRAVCLGCFAVHRVYVPKNHDFTRRPFGITHLPTGLRFGPPFPSKELALQAIKELSVLTDWTPHDPAVYRGEKGKSLGALCRAIFSSLHPDRLDRAGDCPPEIVAGLPRPINQKAIRPCGDLQ